MVVGIPLADQKTLEVVDFIALRSRLAEYACSDRGRANIGSLEPVGDWARAERLCAATTEMRFLLSTSFGIDRISDPSEYVARARRGITLRPPELREIARFIEVGERITRQVRSDTTPVLRSLTDGLRSLTSLNEAFGSTLGPTGDLLESASAQFRSIRRGLLHAVDTARARTGAIAGSPRLAKAVQDVLVTQRDDRFVIPVKAEFAALVPGIVHDASASGQTLFIEPMGVVDLNNRVRMLQREEHHETERILARLSEHVANEAASIGHLTAVVSEIDAAYARARLANEMQGLAPRYVPEIRLTLNEIRHPLLGSAAVPQSLELHDEQRLLIISGPNMGGKTVTLKLTALSVLMAACGLHLPCTGYSEIGAFTKVIAEIGDAQSLIANTSTFAAHLRCLKTMLDAADGGLLFVIDEIASGTETAAGAALATAVLDQLLAAQAHGIVTTHAQELKMYAQARARVSNAGMRFTPITHEPTFELDIGIPGRSLALDLAQREGYDPKIIAIARERIGELELRYDEALAELSAIRSDLAKAQKAVREERAMQQQFRHEMEREREALHLERLQFLQDADQRLREALSRFDTELRRRAPDDLRRVGRTQTEMLARHVGEIRSEFLKRSIPVRSERTLELKKGMVVVVDGFDNEATIVEVQAAKVIVAFGALHMTVGRHEVHIGKTTTSVTRKQDVRRDRRSRNGDHEARLAQAQHASMEIDVRGKRFIEAQPLVERWIEQALAAGVSPIRLIHGKGTGALGLGLQELLRAHGSVRSLRFGNENEGGGGVTMIEL